MREHVNALLRDADALAIPRDVLGRALLAEVTKLWLEERSVEDVSRELCFVAGSIDPETDFEFMRP